MSMLVPVINVNAESTLSNQENYDNLLVDTLVTNQIPLPEELTNYYDSFRAKYYIDFLNMSGFGENLEEDRMKLGILMNYMAVHDAGGLDISSSKLAKEYLKNVSIKPLMENKSVLLQTGEILSFENFEELNRSEARLVEAKLIYYYARDHIYFPHPAEEEKGVKKVMGGIPLLNLLITAVPNVINFPCESVETQHGGCLDQSLLLATLLKMEGYEVALGSMASIGVPLSEENEGNESMVWFSYHSYVYLKDEGWGIGNWTLNEDIFGNKMDGKWILLDAICSPRHFGRMQMVGKGRVLEFGDTPNWIAYKDVTYEPQNELLCSYELINEENAKKAPYE
jgi:hypothetical protein